MNSFWGGDTPRVPLRRCVICREDARIPDGQRAVCRRCRRNPEATADAAWLNVVRHLNQTLRRTR